MELLHKIVECQCCDKAVAFRIKTIITLYDLFSGIFISFSHGQMSLEANRSNKNIISSNHPHITFLLHFHFHISVYFVLEFLSFLFPLCMFPYFLLDIDHPMMNVWHSGMQTCHVVFV